MNGRTARLIRSYALQTKQNPRVIRDRWNSLSAKARGDLREQIVEVLFSTKLIRWRGFRLQKEVADILNVPLPTYVNWEQNHHTPNTLAIEALMLRMKDHPDTSERRP